MADERLAGAALRCEVRSVRQDGAASSSTLADGATCRAARAVLALPVNTLPGDRLRSRASRADRRGARQQRRPRPQGLAARARRPGGRAGGGRGGGPALDVRRSHARRRRRPADRVRLRGSRPSTPPIAGRRASARCARSSRRPSWSPSITTIGSPTPSRSAPGRLRPVGRAELLTAERFPPHGRIAFATSDVASHEPGWIEGALVAGAAAARWAGARG